MTTDPNLPRRCKAYVYLGPRAWATIRRRYLEGESARALAEEFGCSQAAIRKRIQHEGWGKKAAALAADALEPAAVEAGPVAPDGPPAETASDLDPRAAARRALEEATRLLLRGQTARAAEAARISELMARAADRLAGSERAETEPDDAVELEAVRAKVAAMIEAARAEGAREAETGRG